MAYKIADILISRLICTALTLTVSTLSLGAMAQADDLADDSPRPATQTSKLTPAPFNPRLNLHSGETHSGLALPRWVSLKHGQINGRKGPGKTYPHLWTFQRKGMPVIVVNEMDHWRQIRDVEGGESWVRNVALSGLSTAVVSRQTALRKSAKDTSRALATLEPNVLMKVSECAQTYCRVEIVPETDKGKQKGPKGYVLRADIWGVETF